MFSPLQIGHKGSAIAWSRTDGTWNPFTLPDVTIWTYPGQHHEIKHKNPTSGGRYGLERYRFDALLAFARETQQDVMYTIHNHDLSGGRNGTVNSIDHWFTVNVLHLDGEWQHIDENGVSYVNGKAETGIPILYWDMHLWLPLGWYWGDMPF